MSVRHVISFPVGGTALTQFRLVKTPAGIVVGAADTDVVLGVVQDGAAASAPAAAVCIFGETKAIASGEILKGARVCPDSSGRVKTAAAGDLVCGIAMSAAAADGDELNIFFNPSTVVLA
jgi:hypothetical protein